MRAEQSKNPGEKAENLVLAGMILNCLFAVVKIVSGVVGNSYALVADGIESALDIFSSLIVLGGIRISTAPPSSRHPYGLGKAEALAAAVVSVTLIAGAIGIAIESAREIVTPHHPPEPFTLFILVGVVIGKLLISRTVLKAGAEIASTAVTADGWHHYSDAVTSAAAFVGISIALIGGPGYEYADDVAALLASAIIASNGLRIFRQAVGEILDSYPGSEIEIAIRNAAEEINGVEAIDQCRIRKSGMNYLVDIHVLVDGSLSVTEGHEIARNVRRTLSSQPALRVMDTLVHIEPFEGRG